ncbi:MAG: beta strand repeat-containing protein, partial [Planctomycetota bacterium]|jgi:T5SS/PEP-CTERM-associated repeat protein/autotransporter-associated beta strand protein
VDGRGSKWTNSGELNVGHAGRGSLSVTGGGEVSNTAGYVGRYAGAVGTVTVDGTGSKLTISGTLSVGDCGAGSLSVTGGGEVSNTYGFVGFSPGSDGTVTVSGTGSKWTNSEGLYVIRGSMNVSGGGKVSSAGGHVSARSGSDSTVTVDGAGSAWTSSQHFYVGSNYGSGSLHITGGGRVSNSIGNIAFGVDASGTATVDGAGSTWANSSSFWVGAGTRAVGTLSVTGGGRVTCPRGYIAYGDDSAGTVTVSGTGSKWTSSGNLGVAFDGVGSLSVTGGGEVSNTNGIVGYSLGGVGTVTVDGAGSMWTNTETLYVGGDDTGPGGTGAVTVRNGGLVSAAGLVLWHGGVTATADGGRLEVGSITGPADAAVAITDPTGGGEALTIGSADDSSFGGRIVDGAGGPGSVRKVGAGKLTLSALPAWSGATHVQEGILALPAGMFAPGRAVNVAEGAELQAVNMVNRQVTGDGRVTALGPLVIGDMTSTEGWSFAGTLDVGGNNVLLLDADVAELGAATTLAGGGKLNSFNGAQLGPADHADPSFTLTATGSAVIDGDFRQNGLVTGPGGEDWLTFTDDVRGAGSFAGNIAFHGVYSPGNSIAAVALENAAFDATTVLRMELSGDGGGICDFLDVSGALTAGGTLEVVLLDGFAPRQGQAFDLLDWGALTGAFGWTDLPVLAGDLAWDTSSLYETGEISVVPEPATPAILSVAACLLLRRRKRQ